jgi:hypothetical protein
MNIFVLSENPEIAASYHCDQHLHKMILESAQMLSTAAIERGFLDIFPYLYKNTHQKHPCTLWATESYHNMHWLCTLAEELNNLRKNGSHGSMEVVKAVKDYLEDEFPHCHYRHVEQFVFAGPPTIAISSKLSITEKYQKYYRQKHQQWLLDKGAGMSYKGRPVPDFMKD